MVRPRFIAAALGWLLAIGAANAIAAEDAGSEIDAKAVLQKNCARCHSIEATGDSPLERRRSERSISNTQWRCCNSIWLRDLAPGIATCPRSNSRTSRSMPS